MSVQNEKSKTQATRRDEGYFSDSKSNLNSSAGTNESSDYSGAESVRPDGENRSRGNKIKSFVSATVGKLIDRLIQSWKDRKKEAVDCLEWYNSQADKCDKEIELLELMKVELAQTLAEEE
ncbi:hypothetical protein [Dapis sp. BLCC M172]|uniref:hypothetical protein n=1 Tax=Dapis sp. BLCC M172 TaxID=2975281 RepID=UPI003CF68D21